MNVTLNALPIRLSDWALRDRVESTCHYKRENESENANLAGFHLLFCILIWLFNANYAVFMISQFRLYSLLRDPTLCYACLFPCLILPYQKLPQPNHISFTLSFLTV